MKKITFLVFFVLASSIYSQKNLKGPENVSANHFNLSIASGIASPSSNFSDNAFAANGNFFELSSSYYFSKVGAGISIGSFSNPTEGNFLDFSNSQFTDPLISTTNSTENWKTTYYGVGPEFKASLGNAFEATFFTRIGSMSIKPIDLSSEINVGNIDVEALVPVIRFGTTETTKLSYYSAGVKLGYKINDKLNLSILANYLSSLSKEITVSQGIKNVRDINKNGIIDQEDFIDADGTPLNFDVTTSTVKPQSTNFGFGLSYSFGKKTNKTRSDMSAAGAHTNPYFVSNELAGEMTSANPGGSSGNGNIERIKNVYVGKNKISVALTNPAKEKADREKNKRKLVAVSPKNNSHFKNSNEISAFTWKVVGKPITNPNYILEVTKINSNGKPQRTFVFNTRQNSAKGVEIFKDNQLDEGKYKWKVTETTTGTSSNSSFFSMAPCEINFSITNDEIECLGYEGENRKFKICFDSTYQSNSGNLTYSNIGSGLTVYDQTYSALTYTLVSPNPTLLTQIGATTTTVSYCFEVVVNNSVTSIGFGLQGDDLDPSPITCQPGVSANFDDLPDCLCDDCKDIELSFDNFNIGLNLPFGNQFNFNGNINVNVPIYGIEFQIQSYSYTASPSACSEGVGSVEESGMFLMPGTSINNSTSLQLFNETASGSASTNNNATKDIKYTSSSPLTGPIPVNLTIGLPGPISGLDPSCCVIDYEVCIKVIIYYEDGSCKSCVFTHCFQFNNQ